MVTYTIKFLPTSSQISACFLFLSLESLIQVVFLSLWYSSKSRQKERVIHKVGWVLDLECLKVIQKVGGWKMLDLELVITWVSLEYGSVLLLLTLCKF